MNDTMFHRVPMSYARCRRAVATLALSAALLLGAVPSMVVAAPTTESASPPVLTVKGETTRWRLSLLHIWSMLHIPHYRCTSFKVYCKIYDDASFYRFFVLTVRLTNIGGKTADPYDDLNLALKVMPPRFTHYVPGWSTLTRRQPFIDEMRAARRDFGPGDAFAWTPTRPGQTTTYLYVIATNQGESHYGLYNALPYKPYVFLLDTGL